MDSNAGKNILVTGATGRQGGAAARHLLAKGFTVTALTRHPEHAEAHLLARKGARIVEGDMDDPPTLGRALEGAYGVFAVQDAVEHGLDGEFLEGRNLIDAAAAAGVRHVVYSSLASADKDGGMPFASSKAAIEEHLKTSGIPYTILRPVFFMENFDLVREEILGGKLRFPLPPGKKLQMVAADDLGAFASLAFENPWEYPGQAIDIAGAEMTMPQVAQIFAEAIGREVVFEETDPLSLEGSRQGMVPFYAWLGQKGFQVDIPALRARYPWVKTLGEWVQSARWEASDVQSNPMHRPVRHFESPTTT